MAYEHERVRGSNNRALGVAPIFQICSLQFHNSSLSNHEKAVSRQQHDAAIFIRVAEIIMVGGVIVWAMPPNPQ
eukprot:1080598-Amphidinium_carterae.1